MISIHAPREGGDQPADCPMRTSWIFQSTPPVRGATYHRQAIAARTQNFNPRPP